MRTLMLILATVFFVHAAVPRSAAQCRGGSCLPQILHLDWRIHADDPERWYLYQGDRLVGGWDPATGYYRAYDAFTDRWGHATPQAPIETPPIARRPTIHVPNELPTGVMAGELLGKAHYSLTTPAGTIDLTKDAAHNIVGTQLQDDSKKLRITVIGTPQQTGQVVQDLGKLSPELGTWGIVRSYPPHHWAVQPGFVKTGSPTIYCQLPNGKVLHRQDDYQGGGDALSLALRKAKEQYEAAKDPDLRKPNLVAPSLDANKAATYALAVAGGVGGMMYFQRRRRLA